MNENQNDNVSDKDKVIDYLEQFIPVHAQGAFLQAYVNALADCLSVMVCDNGFIYVVFLDGRSRKAFFSVIYYLNKPVYLVLSSAAPLKSINRKRIMLRNLYGSAYTGFIMIA